MIGADGRRQNKETNVKLSIVAALAFATLAASPFRAEACNPMLNKNFGKHVAPAILPAAMLAKNHPATGGQASIVGLWHDVHTASDGTLFLEGYDTWNRTGTESELGNLPPTAGALCVGVWKQHGKTVDLTAHVTWLYDLNNNFVGTLDITEKNKVSEDGNSYTGTFDAKMYDPSGTLFNETTGTTKADRLGD
jgi:hypothetical protein